MAKRAIAILSLAFALAVTALWTAADAHGTQRDLAEKLIRLHVVANSDSEADQALKYRVRDAVLARAEEVLAGCGGVEAAEEVLTDSLPELEAAAAEEVAAAGYGYPVRAALAWEDFPTRAYDTFTLPAGVYLSLRVTIGAGEGRNWWCVVFPPLCMAATTEDFSTGAEAAGLTQEEVALITQDSGGCAVRFKVIEWVETWLADWRD